MFIHHNMYTIHIHVIVLTYVFIVLDFIISVLTLSIQLNIY